MSLLNSPPVRTQCLVHSWSRTLDAAPALAGTLRLKDGSVSLQPEPDSGLLVNGEPAGERELRDDSGGSPDVLSLGRLRLHLIRRGERLGVRVKDPESPVRTGFRGLDHFPVDPGYRVKADYRPYDEPRSREIVSAAGTVSEMFAPGILDFELDGVPLSLEPLVGRPGETSLFIVFRDETSGESTISQSARIPNPLPPCSSGRIRQRNPSSSATSIAAWLKGA